MKKYLLINLLVFFSVSLYAQQTISELTKDCGMITDAKGYVKEQMVSIPDRNGSLIEMYPFQLKWIINLDVVSYYKLGGKYNTDLKKEAFKETDEYKGLVNSLQEEKTRVKNMSFFYIQKLRNTYDLDKGGFLYSVELYEGGYYSFPGFINHGTVCIEYATKRFAKNKIEVIKRWGGSDYFYNQRVILPVKDKQIALKIEDAAYKDVAVLFKFKLDSVKEQRMPLSDKTFILTKTEGIYIVNTRTGEVFCKVL